jgi:hypothetical protein
MDFELRIRRQMMSLFASHGFKPERDIAAIGVPLISEPKVPVGFLDKGFVNI